MATAHSGTSITGGHAAAVAGGAAGFMTGADKTKLDGLAPVDTDAYTYTYSTTTSDADPGAGVIRFDSTTLASITAAYVDLLDATGYTQTTWLDNIVKRGGGALRMIKKTDPAVSVTFTIRNWITASGYRKFTLRYLLDSGGSFSNADPVILQFINTPIIGGRGPDLTDADQSLTPSVSLGTWLMPPATTSTARAKTAGTGSVTAGMTATFVIWPQGHDITIVNGGAGAGTLFTVTAGDGAIVSLRFDGTNFTGDRRPLG